MSASQPSSALLLQSAKPVAHELAGITHWPALQVTGPDTCGSAVQSCPHSPQWRGSSRATH